MKENKPPKSTEKASLKKRIYLICAIGLAAACAVVVGILIRNYMVQKQAEAELDRLIAEMNAAVVAETETETVSEATEIETETETETEAVDTLTALGITVPDKEPDWNTLWDTNPDIYSWIYIPDTNIDYPILQHPTERSYYLTHNLDGSEGYPGCIYTQNRNKTDFTDPMTVIYGHNMKDGSMFRTLHAFEDGEFFENHPYIYIYTPDGPLVYQVFAAYKFWDQDLLTCNDFDTPESLGYYIITVMNQRDMDAHLREDLDTDLNGDSHLITLSTCVSGEDDKRYLVQAVLVNDDALPETEETEAEIPELTAEETTDEAAEE